MAALLAMQQVSAASFQAEVSSSVSEDGEPEVEQPSPVAGPSEAALGLDSNIARAKVELGQRDMATAAGHYYHQHHHHSPSGWLKMGAHTGPKGAFGWHAKYPVGGKGRR